MQKQFITCPKCGTEIDVNAVLYQDITRKVESEHAEENLKVREELKARLAEIEKSKSELAARESGLNAKIASGVSPKALKPRRRSSKANCAAK